MLLHMKSLIAVGILAAFSLVLVSGSIILLTATKQTDGEMIEAVIVDSTFVSLQSNIGNYTPGTLELEDMTVDKKTFERTVTVENLGDKVVEVTLEVEEVKEHSKPAVYRTRFYRS